MLARLKKNGLVFIFIIQPLSPPDALSPTPDHRGRLHRRRFAPAAPHTMASPCYHHYRHRIIRSAVMTEKIRTCAHRTPFSGIGGWWSVYAMNVRTRESLRSVRVCGYIVFLEWKFSPNKECGPWSFIIECKFNNNI